MTHHRPHNARTDQNHAAILRDFRQMVGGWFQLSDYNGVKYKAWGFSICGIQYVIIDTSGHGGLALDYRVYGRDGFSLDVEVKTEEAYKSKDHGMTPGEKLYFELFQRHGVIVTSAEELYVVLRDSQV